MTMTLALTSTQNDALRALRWLHSEDEVDRRTGRTTALAVHYLWLASKNVGVAVEMPTHWPARPREPRLLAVLEYVGNQLGLLFSAATDDSGRVSITVTKSPSAETTQKFLVLFAGGKARTWPPTVAERKAMARVLGCSDKSLARLWQGHPRVRKSLRIAAELEAARHGIPAPPEASESTDEDDERVEERREA